MWSEHKVLIRLAELWSMLGAVACLGFVVAGLLWPNAIHWDKHLFLIGFVASGTPWLLSFLLVREFLERVDPDRIVQGNGRISVSLSKGEANSFYQWASPIVRLLSRCGWPVTWIGLLATTASQLLTDAGPVLDGRVAMSFLIVVGGTFLQCLAPFASVSRMEGTFEENFRPFERLDGDAPRS